MSVVVVLCSVTTLVYLTALVDIGVDNRNLVCSSLSVQSNGPGVWRSCMYLIKLKNHFLSNIVPCLLYGREKHDSSTILKLFLLLMFV